MGKNVKRSRELVLTGDPRESLASAEGLSNDRLMFMASNSTREVSDILAIAWDKRVITREQAQELVVVSQGLWAIALTLQKRVHALEDKVQRVD